MGQFCSIDWKMLLNWLTLILDTLYQLQQVKNKISQSLGFGERTMAAETQQFVHTRLEGSLGQGFVLWYISTPEPYYQEILLSHEKLIKRNKINFFL